MADRTKTFVALGIGAPIVRKLTRDDRWAISRHMTKAVWAVAFMAFTAPSYTGFTDITLTLVWTIAVLVGSLGAAAGRGTHQFFTIELPALLVIMGGLAMYAVTQFAAMFSTGETTRIGLVCLIAVVSHPTLERLTLLLRKLFVALGWIKEGVVITMPRGDA